MDIVGEFINLEAVMIDKIIIGAGLYGLYSALFCASFPQPCEVNKHDVAIPSQRGSGHPDPVFPKFRMYRGLIPGVEPGLTPATLLFSAGPSAFFGLVVTLIGETSPQQVGF